MLNTERGFYGEAQGLGYYGGDLGTGDDFGIDGGFLSTQAQGGGERSGTIAQSDTGRFRNLTVALIHSSFVQAGLEAAIHFFDENVLNFQLVGVVRNLASDPVGKVSFDLDDSTGVIGVEWAPFRAVTDLGPSPFYQRQVDRIAEGVYVRVTGEVNVLGKDEPSIIAHAVAAVDIPLEVFFHQLEVAESITNKLFPNSSSSGKPSSTAPPVLPSADGQLAARNRTAAYGGWQQPSTGLPPNTWSHHL